jgi:predicted transcriptional regulator
METKKTTKPVKSTTISSKTDIRNASAKVGKLLKGIDNDTAAVVKMQDQLNKKTQNIIQTSGLVKDLVAGISNAALATPEPAKPTKVVKTPTPAKPPAVKKPIKPAVSVKPTKAPPTKKPAKPPTKKPENNGKSTTDDRPQLRQLLIDVIDSKQSVKSSDVYHIVEEKANAGGFQVWSRQSVYSILKKLVEQNEFIKSGDGPDAVYSLPSARKPVASDDEADRLISKVESSSSIAAVQ